jgi:DNA-binding NarL/FixJ family response regulator
MDLSTNRMGGAAATRQIVDKKLRARVLILAMHA